MKLLEYSAREDLEIIGQRGNLIKMYFMLFFNKRINNTGSCYVS